MVELLSMNSANDGEIEFGEMSPGRIALRVLEKCSDDYLREVLLDERLRIVRERARARLAAVKQAASVRRRSPSGRRPGSGRRGAGRPNSWGCRGTTGSG
jgi:hypothetical protein